MIVDCETTGDIQNKLKKLFAGTIELMGNNRGGVDMAYNMQSAVDGKNDLILEYDVALNPADQHQLGKLVKK